MAARLPQDGRGVDGARPCDVAHQRPHPEFRLHARQQVPERTLRQRRIDPAPAHGRGRDVADSGTEVALPRRAGPERGHDPAIGIQCQQVPLVGHELEHQSRCPAGPSRVDGDLQRPLVRRGRDPAHPGPALGRDLPGPRSAGGFRTGIAAGFPEPAPLRMEVPDERRIIEIEHDPAAAVIHPHALQATGAQALVELAGEVVDQERVVADQV